MKYLLLILAVLMIGSLLVSTFTHKEKTQDFSIFIESQLNPFKLPADSSEVGWSRANQFINKRYRLISGGTVERNDSVINVPYFNDFRKGNSLKFERKIIGDSVIFTVSLWASGKLQVKGAKEIAFYIRTGIDRYMENKLPAQY
ncbi:MAG: hypothetical protein HXX13_13420 [Bacteroidetes bacterium]|nr:hypothetical protein [Bacteroidota bacterium]